MSISPVENRVLIFDTTLRDGEQSPGCSMTLPEKLRVGRALADLGVDIIEAGFPVASKGDWESVNTIAREVHGPAIAGLARCNAEDIDLCWKAVKDAAKPRIHVFLATSAIHRQYKLNMAKEEIIRTAVAGVTHARSLCDDVEFSTEDASRTELEFLAEVVEAVVAAGAGKVKEDGNRTPLDVKAGDVILFGKYSGQEIKLDGEEYLIMREDEVLAILESKK